MGSFSYTCAVSGLPIEAGDPVYYYLLTQNPYTDSRPCEQHGLWFPRTFPILANYDDYGRGEKFEPGPLKDVWKTGLEIDLVERGWGENCVHDCAVAKSMRFEELVEAIVACRVRVRQNVGRKGSRELDEQLGFVSKVPPGVPTRKRVEKALRDGGFKLYEGAYSTSGFMADKSGHGEVRVRFHGVGAEWNKDAEHLARAQSVLAKYATVITVGSGPYANSAEMRVLPKPGTKDFFGVRRVKEKSLAVNHAMIRKDVWDSLLNLKVEHFGSKTTREIGVDEFRKGARECQWLFMEERERLKKLAGTTPMEELLALLLYTPPRDVPGAWVLSKDIIPFTVGLGTTFSLLMKEAPLPETALDRLGEFAFLHYVLSEVRYMWRPSYSNGPQFGVGMPLARYHTQIGKVIAEQVARQHTEETAEAEFEAESVDAEP